MAERLKLSAADLEGAEVVQPARPARGARGFTLSPEDLAGATEVQPSHDIPLGVRAPEPEPKPHTLYDRFIEGTQGAKQLIGGFGRAAWNDIIQPIGRTVIAPEALLTEPGREALAHDFILTNPHKRRQVERGLSDTVTLGYAENLAGRVDPKGEIKTTAAEDAQVAPDDRSFGQFVGMFSPGGVTTLAKGVGKLLGKVAVKGALPGAALGLAKGVAGYEAVAPAASAAQAAFAGQDPAEAAKKAATDPFGLALAGAGGAAVGAGQGRAAQLRDPSTIEGRTVRDVEAAGGKIKAIGKPAKGGLFESSDVADLKEGRAGINELATNAEERIREAQGQKLSEARQSYGEEMDSILSEHANGGPASARKTVQIPVQSMEDMVGERPSPQYPTSRRPTPTEAQNAAQFEDVTQEIPRYSMDELMGGKTLVDEPVARPSAQSAPAPVEPAAPKPPKLYPAQKTAGVLDEMERRSKLSGGKIADKKLHGFVQEMRDLISTDTDQIDRQHLIATGEAKVIKQQALPVEDLIKVKQVANDAAEWGQPATRDNAPYRLIYHALTEDAAKVDPRIAELNKRYGQTMEELKAANDILYSRKSVDAPTSSTKQRSAAAKLGRIGDETQSATTAEPQLDQLEQMGPEYARELRLLRAKKAQERLRYGEPETSTSIEKGISRGHRGVMKHVAGAVGLHAAGPVGAALGYVGGKLYENPLAARLRLELPLSEAIGSREGVPSSLAARLYLAREAQNRRRLELMGAP